MTSLRLSSLDRNRLRSIFLTWSKLTFVQKLSVILLYLLVLVLPVIVFLAVTPKIPLFSRAQTPATPPVTPPIVNNPPIILTDSLPGGKLRQRYNATVIGEDIDLNDSLKMNISGLPKGLKLNRCTKTVQIDKQIINCPISGRPVQGGSFEVNVMLQDSFGNTTQKVLNLQVN